MPATDYPLERNGWRQRVVRNIHGEMIGHRHRAWQILLERKSWMQIGRRIELRFKIILTIFPEPRRLVPFHQIDTDCTTWREMYGNGLKKRRAGAAEVGTKYTRETYG